MSVLVISGYQKAWCDFAVSRLGQMGLAEPAPAVGSELDLHALTEKMRKAHKVENQPRGAISQISPGKAWQLKMADIVLHNAELGSWVWGDPANVHFLDFWRDLDSTCRFVLLYGSPAESLAQQLQAGEGWAKTLAHEFDVWLSYHDALLKFYNANPERCVLVHVSQLGDTAQELAQLMTSRFKIELHGPGLSEDPDLSELAKVIAQQAAHEQETEGALFMELEGTADLPALRPSCFSADARKAQAEFLDFQNNQNPDPNEDLEEENHLLQMQLEQVQEELELYFRKYQELKKSPVGATNVVTQAQAIGVQGPTSVEVDMRSFIDGDGWHSAEAHGRWAGQSQRSSVNLPPLQPGPYKVTVEIIDAMSVDLAKAIKLEFNGHAIVGKLKILSNMGGRLAPVRRLKADLQQVEKPYPAIITASIPASVINSGENKNQLNLLSEQTLSPASQGGQDGRQLSICVSTIRLDKAA